MESEENEMDEQNVAGQPGQGAGLRELEFEFAKMKERVEAGEMSERVGRPLLEAMEQTIQELSA